MIVYVLFVDSRNNQRSVAKMLMDHKHTTLSLPKERTVVSIKEGVNESEIYLSEGDGKEVFTEEEFKSLQSNGVVTKTDKHWTRYTCRDLDVLLGSQEKRLSNENFIKTTLKSTRILNIAKKR